MEEKTFFYGESIFLLPTHTSISDNIPSRDSVIDIKNEKREKFKYEKICETLKFMAEQYYFVCMCLCYRRWTHEPNEDVKKGILSGRSFHLPKEKAKRFFTFLSIFLGENKSFPTPNLTPHRSYFITSQKFIFPWIQFLLFIFIKYCEREANDCWNMFQGSRGQTAKLLPWLENLSWSKINAHCLRCCQKFISSVVVDSTQPEIAARHWINFSIYFRELRSQSFRTDKEFTRKLRNSQYKSKTNFFMNIQRDASR